MLDRLIIGLFIVCWRLVTGIVAGIFTLIIHVIGPGTIIVIVAIILWAIFRYLGII